MKSGFVTGMVAGTMISAALMSMYMGQNPREAAKMGKRMNRNMQQMMDRF